MNTEFVGMKRPIILHDELSLKHEAQRKKSASRFPYLMVGESLSITDPEIPRVEEENHVLFIDVQNGNLILFGKSQLYCL